VWQPEDVPPLLLLKSATPHLGKDLDAMKATATALKERSLEMFKTALKDYTERELRPIPCSSLSVPATRRMPVLNTQCRAPARPPHPLPPVLAV
jgi:hypothetical protein